MQADGSSEAIAAFFAVLVMSLAGVGIMFYAWHTDYYFTDTSVTIVRGLARRKTYPIKELTYIYGVYILSTRRRAIW